ncbi:MAG: FAD-binding oxidoreductase [Alphaproteobacteria bacterium]|nr:FAD-binding oxidoreductase [Alphaproteobacteria bacterium]
MTLAPPPRPKPLDPGLIDRFKALLGAKGWTQAAADLAPHLKEWRDLYRGETPLMLKPASTAEVAAILKLCHETATPVVPQGGNTGMCGGAIPFGQVLLWLGRMNRIRALDPLNDTLVAEAGVVLAQVQEAADRADRLFPLSFGGEGSAMIGGNLSTNAGGSGVLRYGNARDLVLGIEAVLPDGTVWDGLRALRKDNTGYDLKHLFIGAEGTLGVITAAVLKLYPKPRDVQTAFAAVRDPAAAVELLARLQGLSGGAVTGFEIVPRLGIDMLLRHIPGTRDPLPAPHAWYLLIELSSGRASGALRETLETGLAEAQSAGLIADASLAQNQAQADGFWRLRDALSEAQNKEGARAAHDVSVPRSAIPEFIDRAVAACARAAPGVRCLPFGHIGDGNIHFNVSQPAGGDRAAFLARFEAINHAVYDVAHALGGSISAEHGLGRMKVEEILRYKDPVEMAVMRRIKALFDPKGIMNPGKVLEV